MTLLTTGCGAGSSKGTIAVIVKSSTSAYWDSLHLGVNDAAGETGYTIDYSAPETEADIDVQEQLVLDAISKGVKAIVIAPIDAESLNDELAQADQAGIPVICVDSDSTFSQKKVFISSNNYNAGSIEGRQAGELLVARGGGTVAIVGHSQGAGNAIGRISGFMDALITDYGASVSDLTADQYLTGTSMTYEEAVALGKSVREEKGYPEIRIVGLQYCDGKKELALENAENFLKATPDLDMLFATNQTSTLAVCEKVTELGVEKRVIVLGFDCGEAQLLAMNDGILNGTIVQSPYNMGYLGVRYAHKCINNEKIPTLVDTGVTFVNLKNLNDPGIQLLINPQEFESIAGKQ